jgi:hypothetical protein
MGSGRETVTLAALDPQVHFEDVVLQRILGKLDHFDVSEWQCTTRRIGFGLGLIIC